MLVQSWKSKNMLQPKHRVHKVSAQRKDLSDADSTNHSRKKQKRKDIRGINSEGHSTNTESSDSNNSVREDDIDLGQQRDTIYDEKQKGKSQSFETDSYKGMNRDDIDSQEKIKKRFVIVTVVVVVQSSSS